MFFFVGQGKSASSVQKQSSQMVVKDTDKDSAVDELRQRAEDGSTWK